MVTRKIDEILKMNVPVSMICPSHGVIWREDPLQIVYRGWSIKTKINEAINYF